jgi:hypothetical protein
LLEGRPLVSFVKLCEFRIVEIKLFSGRETRVRDSTEECNFGLCFMVSDFYGWRGAWNRVLEQQIC